MSGVTSIILAGVGGQGTIFASKLLTQGLVSAGYDVKMSEVHGMAQRGGSVSTQVRYGDRVYSPIVGPGEADILVAFEKMEAVRYSSYLKPEGVAIINDHEIPPLPVASGLAVYPGGLVEAMRASFRTIVFDAAALAEHIGNPKTMNVALFGAMVSALRMQGIDWERMLESQVPPAYLQVNLTALREGMAIGAALKA